MSHIHIPDGVLPVWYWVSGYLVTFIMLGIVLSRLKGPQFAKKLPVLGVIAAVILLAMSIEIVPIAYHVNLMVLAGIILGPALGILAAFSVNLILALIAHGGITVVGLNTITASTEVVLGWLLFNFLSRMIKKPFVLGFSATFITLIISTLLTIGIVALGTSDFSKALEIERGGIVRVEAGKKAEEQNGQMDISTYGKLTLGLGFFGWLLESTSIGFLISYIISVRPSLIYRRSEEART
jgi:cobalt/nickel transport system permease protein